MYFTHCHFADDTYLQVIVIEVEGRQMCEGPEVGTQILDRSSDFHLCPIGRLAILVVLAGHNAITPSQRLK